jgi:uncharacterized membrane protein
MVKQKQYILSNLRSRSCDLNNPIKKIIKSFFSKNICKLSKFVIQVIKLESPNLEKIIKFNSQSVKYQRIKLNKFFNYTSRFKKIKIQRITIRIIITIIIIIIIIILLLLLSSQLLLTLSLIIVVVVVVLLKFSAPYGSLVPLDSTLSLIDLLAFAYN